MRSFPVLVPTRRRLVCARVRAFSFFWVRRLLVASIPSSPSSSKCPPQCHLLTKKDLSIVLSLCGCDVALGQTWDHRCRLPVCCSFCAIVQSCAQMRKTTLDDDVLMLLCLEYFNRAYPTLSRIPSSMLLRFVLGVSCVWLDHCLPCVPSSL